jgi:hypothetical protein
MAEKYDAMYPVTAHGDPVDDYIPFLTIPFPDEFRRPEIDNSCFFGMWPLRKGVHTFVPINQESRKVLNLKSMRNYYGGTYRETLESIHFDLQGIFMSLPYEILTQPERDLVKKLRYDTWNPGCGKEESYYKKYYKVRYSPEEYPWIGMTKRKFSNLLISFATLLDRILCLVKFSDDYRLMAEDFPERDFSYEQTLCTFPEAFGVMIGIPRLVKIMEQVLYSPIFVPYWDEFLYRGKTGLTVVDEIDRDCLKSVFWDQIETFIREPYNFSKYNDYEEAYNRFSAPKTKIYVNGKLVD